jgi:hypothetical protein
MAEAEKSYAFYITICSPFLLPEKIADSDWVSDRVAKPLVGSVTKVTKLLVGSVTKWQSDKKAASQICKVSKSDHQKFTCC